MSEALRRLDRLQRRRPALGFAYAVVRKYLDDDGAREAALITYYGFLGVFPALLLARVVVGWVLRNRPALRDSVIDAMVPPSLHATVEGAGAALPTARVALLVGLAGLVLSATGVVRAARYTLNHLAAVPYRLRSGVLSGAVRVLTTLALVLAGTITAGGLVVVAAAYPGLPWTGRLAAVAGELATAFVVLLLAARLLLARPASVRELWPAAVAGAVAVTAALELGAAVLPGLVRGAGPVYGGFATVAAMFTLLYVLSNALVLAGEAAAVRRARLWPRALDQRHPTAADAYALTLLAREQERIPGQSIRSRLAGSSAPDDEDAAAVGLARRHDRNIHRS